MYSNCCLVTYQITTFDPLTQNPYTWNETVQITTDYRTPQGKGFTWEVSDEALVEALRDYLDPSVRPSELDVDVDGEEMLLSVDGEKILLLEPIEVAPLEEHPQFRLIAEMLDKGFRLHGPPVKGSSLPAHTIAKEERGATPVYVIRSFGQSKPLVEVASSAEVTRKAFEHDLIRLH